jgi:LEA14-like dessication related protein
MIFQKKYLLVFLLPLLPCKRLMAQKVKELEYREVKNFRLKGLSLEKTKVSFDMVYYNPNKYMVNLKDGQAEIYIDNKDVGKALFENKIEIPQKDTFSLPITLEINNSAMMSSAFAYLSNAEVTLKVDGTAKLGRLFLYIVYPIKYEGKQKL